jgi:hypothetical protein
MSCVNHFERLWVLVLSYKDVPLGVRIEFFVDFDQPLGIDVD